MKWSAPGCKGTFYCRGKNRIIYYYHERLRTSLKLLYSKKNKEIAADIIRQRELSGIVSLDPDKPRNLEEAWKLFKTNFKDRKAFNTINNTKLALNKLIGENIELQNINKISNAIEKNIVKTQILPRSVNSYLASLKAFFNWLKEKKYITDNPIRKSFQIKIPDKKIETYTDSELAAIFEYWKAKNFEFYLFIRFLYESAFRLKEAYNLKWKQILTGNKFNNVIFIPKSKYGDRKETFPMSDEIKNIFKEVLSYKNSHDKEQKVFTLTHKRNVSKSFDQTMKDLGIPKHLQYENGNGRALHTIRKTRITHWVERQLLSEVVVEKLSRDNYSTVRKYYANLENLDLMKYMKSFSELSEGS
ncbi:MAG: tyrosine-type recombinase/integrase [bacterium]